MNFPYKPNSEKSIINIFNTSKTQIFAFFLAIFGQNYFLSKNPAVTHNFLMTFERFLMTFQNFEKTNDPVPRKCAGRPYRHTDPNL